MYWRGWTYLLQECSGMFLKVFYEELTKPMVSTVFKNIPLLQKTLLFVTINRQTFSSLSPPLGGEREVGLFLRKEGNVLRPYFKNRIV
jgi:hypothetical protein